MGLISAPNTFTAGTTALASQVNSNFSTIYNEFNGNITNTNISPAAAIALTKISLSDDATFTGDISFTNSATTDDVVTITANSLTSGSAIKVTSSASSTTARKLVEIVNDNSAASAVACIDIDNDASGPAINIGVDGGGPAIRFEDSVAVTGPVAGDFYREGSTLKFFDGTNEKTLSVDTDGLCKAWVNFTPGSPPTVNNHFNASSVTHITGNRYWIYFDTAFADSDIAVSTMVVDVNGVVSGAYHTSAYGGISTTGIAVESMISSSAGTTAVERIMLQAFGDQA